MLASVECPSSDTVVTSRPRALVEGDGRSHAGVLESVPDQHIDRCRGWRAQHPGRLEPPSLYAAPALQEPRDGEPGAAQLEHRVAALGRSVEPFSEWCRLTWRKVEPGVQRFCRFGNEAYVYLQEPTKELYPWAGIIGFTGMLGLLLTRGSRMKKPGVPGLPDGTERPLYYPDKAAVEIFLQPAGCAGKDQAVRPEEQRGPGSEGHVTRVMDITRAQPLTLT